MPTAILYQLDTNCYFRFDFINPLHHIHIGIMSRYRSDNIRAFSIQFFFLFRKKKVEEKKACDVYATVYAKAGCSTQK